MKPPLTFMKVDGALRPTNQNATDAVQKLASYKDVAVEIKNTRNLAHLNKYWVMLGFVVNNSDNFQTDQQVHFSVKCLMGYAHIEQKTINGTMIFIKHETSIAMNSMSQQEFNDYYRDAVRVVLAHLIPVEKHELFDAIAMGF